MSKLKKCGEFMEKDGVVVKRPGKKFVCPRMPEKMRASYYTITGIIADLDGTEEMNALKEVKWQQVIKNKHSAMKRLYYFQQLTRFVQQTSQKILRVFSGKDHKKSKLISAEHYASLHASHDL